LRTIQLNNKSLTNFNNRKNSSNDKINEYSIDDSDNEMTNRLIYLESQIAALKEIERTQLTPSLLDKLSSTSNLCSIHMEDEIRNKTTQPNPLNTIDYSNSFNKEPLVNYQYTSSLNYLQPTTRHLTMSTPNSAQTMRQSSSDGFLRRSHTGLTSDNSLMKKMIISNNNKRLQRE
jgi:hypothetical protein